MVSNLLFLKSQVPRHSGYFTGNSIGSAYNGLSIKTEKSQLITLKLLTAFYYSILLK